MSRTPSIDELSRMAGERWTREEAKQRQREKEGADREPRGPGRARPHHGSGKPGARKSTSLGGEHT
jgi:hypothetical protein